MEMEATLISIVMRMVCITVVSLKKTRSWLTEKPPAIKFDCPQFDKINNPGCWSAFSYQPRYDKKKYIGHFILGGATVFSKVDGDTKCIIYNESKTQRG
eukprot:7298365-Ditylum_brightwellii.AAC.1